MFSTIEADGGWIKKVQKCAKVIKGWSLGTIGNLKGFFQYFVLEMKKKSLKA